MTVVSPVFTDWLWGPLNVVSMSLAAAALIYLFRRNRSWRQVLKAAVPMAMLGPLYLPVGTLLLVRYYVRTAPPEQTKS